MQKHPIAVPITFIAALIVALVVATGCSPTSWLDQKMGLGPKPPTREEIAAQQAASIQERVDAHNADFVLPEGYKEVLDSVGRKVAVPLEVERVTALDPFAGEAVILMGAGHKLVTLQGGTQSAVLLQQLAPNIVGTPAAKQGGAINVETLLASNADVALLQEADWVAMGDQSSIDSLGIPYAVVGYESIDDQIDAIRFIGEICNAQEQASGIIDFFNTTVKLVEEKSIQIPEDERIRVYHAITGSLSTDGRDSVGDDMMGRVGLINVAREVPQPAGTREIMTTLEQIYLWNPEAIVCNAAGTTREFQSDTQWEGLSAVQSEQVYTMPIGATRWGQRGSVETYLGMVWLGKTLYPAYYEDIDLEKYVTDYYRDVIGLEIDSDIYQQMLTGEGLRKASGTSDGAGDGTGGGGGQ